MDKTNKTRQANRTAQLNTLAHSRGWKSWSAFSTAVINGQAELPKPEKRETETLYMVYYSAGLRRFVRAAQISLIEDGPTEITPGVNLSRSASLSMVLRLNRESKILPVIGSES